jgi:hypothetical protein
MLCTSRGLKVLGGVGLGHFRERMIVFLFTACSKYVCGTTALHQTCTASKHLAPSLQLYQPPQHLLCTSNVAIDSFKCRLP